MKFFYKAIMDAALRLYLLFNTAPTRLPADNTYQPQRIIVFSNTALGDTLLSTPAMLSLRQSYPRAHIALFVHRNVLPLFRNAEYLDEVVPYHGGYHRFVSTVLRLRRIRPDTAILLHSNGPQDIPMAVFSGAKVILKHPTNSPYKYLLSTEIAPGKEHVIEQNLDLARVAGATQTTTRMALPARYSSQVPENYLVESGGRTLVGFQPGAANIYKCWPIERFAELGRKLTSKDDITGDITIVITGTAAESRLATPVIDACPPGRVINTCGRYRLDELPWLVKQLALLVTNDTGTMHLAVALGVPTVCLFAASLPERIGPYQDRERHVIIDANGLDLVRTVPKRKRTDAAMRLIEVDQVYAAALAQLSKFR